MSTPNVIFALLFFLFLAASAFFAASETALVALGRIELQRMRDRRVRGTAVIENLKKSPTRLLSTALIGQNLFNSAASAVATVAAENLFGEKIGIAVAVVLSTVLLFTFGEMTPKSVAAASPLRVALTIARPFEFFSRIVGPVAAVVISLVNATLKALGFPETRPAMTEEEMKAVINLGHAEGVIHHEQKDLLVRVLEFGGRSVAEVMVPRPKIVALPDGATFAQARELFALNKFSRVPVFHETLDNVVGTLKAKDLFSLSPDEERDFTAARLMAPPFLVPEFKRLEELFREMRRRRQHLAIAVDEYGGTAGLVTIEDVIETLLGSIQDEDDEEAPGFEKVDEHTFVLDGSLRLSEMERRFGLRYPSADADTVAGLLLLRFRRIPKPGDRIRGRQAEYVVLQATPTAIKKVKMILPRKTEEVREERKLQS